MDQILSSATRKEEVNYARMFEQVQAISPLNHSYKLSFGGVCFVFYRLMIGGALFKEHAARH